MGAGAGETPLPAFFVFMQSLCQKKGLLVPLEKRPKGPAQTQRTFWDTFRERSFGNANAPSQPTSPPAPLKASGPSAPL